MDFILNHELLILVIPKVLLLVEIIIKCLLALTVARDSIQVQRTRGALRWFSRWQWGLIVFLFGFPAAILYWLIHNDRNLDNNPSSNLSNPV